MSHSIVMGVWWDTFDSISEYRVSGFWILGFNLLIHNRIQIKSSIGRFELSNSTRTDSIKTIPRARSIHFYWNLLPNSSLNPMGPSNVWCNSMPTNSAPIIRVATCTTNPIGGMWEALQDSPLWFRRCLCLPPLVRLSREMLERWCIVLCKWNLVWRGSMWASTRMTTFWHSFKLKVSSNRAPKLQLKLQNLRSQAESNSLVGESAKPTLNPPTVQHIAWPWDSVSEIFRHSTKYPSWQK